MKNTKRFFFLLMIALLSLVLLAGCNSSDSNSRDADETGDMLAVDLYGTVQRNGEQIDVCVCHDQKTVYLYYNDEEHKLFDIAMLPTGEIRNDEDWNLSEISLRDFNGDNNSDLQVYLSHSDMSESYIVWTWEEGKGYVYQPNDSWFYHSATANDPNAGSPSSPPSSSPSFPSSSPSSDPNAGSPTSPPSSSPSSPPSSSPSSSPSSPSNGGTVNSFSMYEGVWLGEADNIYDDIYIEFDREGYWKLYSSGNLIDEGNLNVTAGNETTVVSYRGGAIDGGYAEIQGNRLYISTLGYFSHRVSEDDTDINYDGEDGEYSETPELYHRDTSEFQGTWYLNNDLAATSYIVIDSYGNWRYYERVPGDPEATQMDYGTLCCSADESYTYYANSSMYVGVWFRMYDQSEGVFLWDGAAYYRME